MRRFSLLAALPLAAFLGACDTGLEADGELTQADVEALAPAMIALTSGASEAALANQGAAQFRAAGEHAPSFAVSQIAVDFSHGVQCPVAGTLQLGGSLDVEADTEAGWANYLLEAAAVHTGCSFETESGLFEIDGNPAIDVRVAFEITDFELVGGEITHIGGFRWNRGDSSGVCGVELTSALDVTGGTMTTTGTFCGVQVEEIHQWEPDTV